MSGKVAVVTGASRGTGLGIAQRLASAGARVFAAARSEVRADGVVSVPADMATPDGPGLLVSRALRDAGGIDVVVNNVGGLATPRFEGFGSVTDEQWQYTLDLNLFAAIRTIRAALPSLVARRGSIVNISSIGAVKPEPPLIDYAAAKAALNATSKALSVELGPRGVRVNTVSLGPILTPGWTAEGALADQLAAAAGVDRDTAMASMIEGLGGVSLRRWGTTAEVADAVLFLASDVAGFITGADLRVDGGLYKGM